MPSLGGFRTATWNQSYDFGTGFESTCTTPHFNALVLVR